MTKRRPKYRIRVTNITTNESMLYPTVFTSMKSAEEMLYHYIKPAKKSELRFDIVKRF